MSNVETTKTRLRVPRAPRPEPVASAATLNIASPTSRVLLVDFRSGEPVHRHPDIAPLLSDGWIVKSAVPRLVENQGLKLLVVLKRTSPVLS